MTTKKTTISTSIGIGVKELVIGILSLVGAWTIGAKSMDIITQGIHDRGPDG